MRRAVAALDRRCRRYADRRYPAPRVVDWVREGVEMPGSAADDFPTDGVPYVYSTLRPRRPPRRLARADRRGRQLAPRGRICRRSPSWASCSCRRGCRYGRVAVGAVIVALVLAGALMPTFSAQILNGVLAVASLSWPCSGPSCSWRGERRPPGRAGRPATARHGVDLSQYQPEPPLAEPPPGSPKPEDGQHAQNEGQSEGGQTNA